MVVNSVLVMTGVRLTIEPGVQVRFNAAKALQIDGELVARGSSEAPIVFTSNLASPGAGDWDYILFTDSSLDATYDGDGNYLSGCVLQQTVVEYAGGGDDSDVWGALRINAAAPLIEQTTVRDSASDGIRVLGPQEIEPVEIRSGAVSNSNGTGIYVVAGA